MRTLSIVILLTILLVGIESPAMATDEPTHQIVKKSGNIEIRRYEETVIAEVTVQGSFKKAGNQAFSILFKYISGANTAQKDIAMTAPVVQQENSQKIAMTAPVAQKQNTDGTWTIGFFMPNDYTLAITPTPTDTRVRLRSVPGQTVAVIRFSGFWSEQNFEKHTETLRQYLQSRNIAFDETPTVARYNPPFTPWFMRRNEVQFRLLNPENLD